MRLAISGIVIELVIELLQLINVLFRLISYQLPSDHNDNCVCCVCCNIYILSLLLTPVIMNMYCGCMIVRMYE